MTIFTTTKAATLTVYWGAMSSEPSSADEAVSILQDPARKP